MLNYYYTENPLCAKRDVCILNEKSDKRPSETNSEKWGVILNDICTNKKVRVMK
jgi:hypothetical protein